jgi:hypothetical protein
MKMIDYLYRCDRYDDALKLARRCSVHDHSKFEMDEVAMFIKMLDESDGNNPNGILTDEQKKLIEMHWKRNRHHPEFFTSYTKMDDIDILEMVCDWYARSLQFGNNFTEYVENVPQKRFGFDEEFFTKVKQYCDVLSAN